MAKTELKPIDITRYTITENGNVIRSKTTNEELKEQDIRLNKLCFDYQEKEKQIADLEWQLQQVIEDNDYYQKENEELQKENEELQEEINEWKTKFENLQKYLDTQNCYRECAEVWGNLTKAKELLNMFLRLHYRPIIDEYTLFCKVKQFIKDSEV